MDEPTAALAGKDVELLHGVVRSLAAAGRSVILISHFLADVLARCDTVTVLRDGSLIHTSAAADETEARILARRLRRTLAAVFPGTLTRTSIVSGKEGSVGV